MSRLVWNVMNDYPEESDQDFQKRVRQTASELLKMVDENMVESILSSDDLEESIAALYVRIVARKVYGNYPNNIKKEILDDNFDILLEEFEDAAQAHIERIAPGYPKKGEILIRNNKRVG